MENTNQIPEVLEELIKKAQEINFEMGTDYLVGELLQHMVVLHGLSFSLMQKKTHNLRYRSLKKATTFSPTNRQYHLRRWA